jgi:hypothetical protein
MGFGALDGARGAECTAHMLGVLTGVTGRRRGGGPPTLAQFLRWRHSGGRASYARGRGPAVFGVKK